MIRNVKNMSFLIKKSTAERAAAALLGISLLFTGCGSTAGGKTSSSVKSKEAASSEKTSETSSKDGTVTVRSGVMTSTAEQYIAVAGEEKGLWKKNGVDLKVTEFGTGVEAVDAVQTGQLDVAEIMDFAIINRIGNTSDKTNLRLYEINYQSEKNSGDSVTANKFYVNPKKISSGKDLKGKRIAVTLGAVNEYQNSVLLEHFNIPENQVKQVPVSSMPEIAGIAQSGQADGAWAATTTAKKLIDIGWKPLVTAIDLGLPTTDIGVTNKDFAENDALTKYLKARDKVIDYILNNEDEAVKIISKKTSAEEDIVKDTIDRMDFRPVFSADSVDSLTKLKNWALKKGGFKKDFNLKDFIDTSALEKAFPDRVTY